MKKRDFKELTNDIDTKIISRTLTEINKIPCVYEIWNWDGIVGDSIIFYKDDIKIYSDDEIVALACKKLNRKIEEYTISTKDLFTFLNFNFKTN